MYGMSPKVAAPIATARTKCRRSNLPSRRPLQHSQEASRRTICNVVIVPLLAWSRAHRIFAEGCPFTLILHMRGRQKCATATGDVGGSERGPSEFAAHRSITWWRRRIEASGTNDEVPHDKAGAIEAPEISTARRARRRRREIDSKLSPGGAISVGRCQAGQRHCFLACNLCV